MNDKELLAGEPIFIADFDFSLTTLFTKLDKKIIYARRSPNKKYIIAWHKKGFCVLDTHTLQYRKFKKGMTIESCWISDTGIFIVEDWLRYDQTNGKVYIGQFESFMLSTRHFKANIYNTEMSADGTWIAVQLCRSKNADSNKRYSFDLCTMQWNTIPQII